MSQENVPSEEQQETLSWEEAVLRFLEDNPEFFARHPDALLGLRIPHAEAGGAVSLIERQIQVLRDQNKTISRQLQDLVAIARENENLSERLHQFAVAMIDSASLGDVLDSAEAMLRQEFSLDAVGILLAGEARQDCDRPEVVGTDPRLAELVRRLGWDRRKGMKPVCTNEYDPAALDFIFGARAGEIKSCALVPLGGGVLRGVLGLGSKRRERFRPHMGTVYLGKFGEMVYRAAARYLA